jgi:hypothetical protein
MRDSHTERPPLLLLSLGSKAHFHRVVDNKVHKLIKALERIAQVSYTRENEEPRKKIATSVP